MSNNMDFTDDDMAEMANAMEKEEQEGKFQSRFWTPKNEGVTPVRIISPLHSFNEKIFYLKYRQHYIGGHPYLCLNQTLTDKNGKVHESETCPICQKVKQLYNMSDNKDSEEAKVASGLNAKDRYVCRIIVRGKKDKENKDAEAIPEFYEFGKKIHEMLFNFIKLGEYGNFLSLKNGRDLNLSKKGTGRSTDYSGTALSVKQTPVFSDPEKIKKLAEELPKLDYKQLVEFKSSDELEKVLNDYLNGGEETTSAPKTTVGAPITDKVKDAVKAEKPVEETPDTTSELDDILNNI